MQSTTKFIGLDVSKEKFRLPLQMKDRPSLGITVPLRIRPPRCVNSSKSLGLHIPCPFCEAGPTGYETHRWIESMGHMVWSSPLPSSPNVQETG